jgi:NAD(P)H-flavin reductase
VLTLPIREVLPATPRARIVRIGLDGHPFSYAAGQAIVAAEHGVEPRKPYSIAAAPEDAARDGWLELLVGVDENGRAAHLPLERGALVDVEGPVGTFTFPANPVERRFIFIAGGTGIAPLRAMLGDAMRVPGATIGVVYSARTAAEFAYDEELLALARAGRIELRQAATRDAPPGWPGRRGRLGRLDLEPLVHDPNTLCFVCGPRSLVEEMPGLLMELGVARERIRIEEW